MSPITPPIARTQLLVRAPVRAVFDAFADPAITTKFWFTDSTGPLNSGARVTWTWSMYGISTNVVVTAFEQDRRIAIDWNEPVTHAEWDFTARADGTTMVAITSSGFAGDDDSAVSAAIDSMGGFSFVLASVKALLEHNIELNIVRDHAPDAHVKNS